MWLTLDNDAKNPFIWHLTCAHLFQFINHMSLLTAMATVHLL